MYSAYLPAHAAGRHGERERLSSSARCRDERSERRTLPRSLSSNAIPAERLPRPTRHRFVIGWRRWPRLPVRRSFECAFSAADIGNNGCDQTENSIMPRTHSGNGSHPALSRRTMLEAGAISLLGLGTADLAALQSMAAANVRKLAGPALPWQWDQTRCARCRAQRVSCRRCPDGQCHPLKRRR